MKSKDLIPKSKRIRYYKALFKIAEKSNYDVGICIVLGELAFGSFEDAPFNVWDGAVRYFPELSKLIPPKGLFGCFSRRTRKRRIEQLKQIINP